MRLHPSDSSEKQAKGAPSAEAIPAETVAPVSPLSQSNALDTLVALTPLLRGNLAALGLASWLVLEGDSLVRILNLCLQFEISEDNIDEIELGIRKWVVDYEWCVRPFRSKKTKADSIHAPSLYYQHLPE
ncbi:hypothetical protein BGY98DRAFT_1182231 [Russula aff. rugulosa BPL654]|nr:hypothetical protein BGY98DRAFT_1182231 [Russula aff. rugulosa BPL654]